MSNHFPIPSPPPDLVQRWEDRIFDEEENVDVLLIEAYKAGADQELEACCEWFVRDWTDIETADNLRAARRPKPPSLKEQAKFAAAVLRSPDETCSIAELQQHWHIICNALEQLDD